MLLIRWDKLKIRMSVFIDILCTYGQERDSLVKCRTGIIKSVKLCHEETAEAIFFGNLMRELNQSFKKKGKFVPLKLIIKNMKIKIQASLEQNTNKEKLKNMLVV